MNRLTRPNGSYILATFPKINLLVRMLPNAEVGTKKRKHILVHTTEFQGCLSLVRCRGWGWFLVLCAPGEWLIAPPESYLTITSLHFCSTPQILKFFEQLDCTITVSHWIQRSIRVCWLFHSFRARRIFFLVLLVIFLRHKLGTKRSGCIQIPIHRDFDQLLNFSKEI